MDKLKNIGVLLVLFIIFFFCIRAYDYITKKPEPISRELDPKILRLAKEISNIRKQLEISVKSRDSVEKVFNLRIDSVKINNRKANYEKKKLYFMPDSNLIHIRDSIRKVTNFGNMPNS